MRLIAVLALVALSAAVADAGPLRRGRAATYQQQSYRYEASSCATGSCPAPASFAPAANCPGGVCPLPAAAGAGDGAEDALAQVNAQRAARGLRPYLRDEGLFQAARGAAAFRARHRLFGHTSSDFAFLPPGVSAAAAGCAAYPQSYGFMACAVYENYTFAGAAWVPGGDGKMYCHLFVR